MKKFQLMFKVRLHIRPEEDDLAGVKLAYLQVSGWVSECVATRLARRVLGLVSLTVLLGGLVGRHRCACDAILGLGARDVVGCRGGSQAR